MIKTLWRKKQSVKSESIRLILLHGSNHYVCSVLVQVREYKAFQRSDSPVCSDISSQSVNLYEQVDRVTMGSPLVLLMVNAFMCHIEENWETKTRCLCFLVNTEWNPPPLSVSQWNLRTTTDFPFLEWWLSETVPDQTRRSTGNQLILEFYDVTKAMMKQP